MSAMSYNKRTILLIMRMTSRNSVLVICINQVGKTNNEMQEKKSIIKTKINQRTPH